MPTIQFTAKLESAAVRGARGGVILFLPKTVSAKLPSRGIVRVVVTIQGKRFRSAAFPTGDGRHYMAANRQMREAAGAGVGQRVEMALEVDTAPRVVVVPPDLKRALARNKKAKAAFDKMPYSHRKEYVGYVDEAKRPDTRARRIEQTLAMLTAESDEAA